jgi:hypothetical protein
LKFKDFNYTIEISQAKLFSQVNWVALLSRRPLINFITKALKAGYLRFKGDIPRRRDDLSERRRTSRH